MRITYASLSAGLANTAFLALFPGFFFYHSLVGLGLMPSLLGGFFSPVALLMLPALGCLYVHQLMKNRLGGRRVDAAFFGFIAYFVLVLSVQAAERANGDVLRSHWLAVLQLTVTFMIFRMADFTMVRRAAVLSLLGMAGIIFWFAQDGIFHLLDQSLISYQGFARSYLVTALVVLMLTTARWQRLALYAISVSALYLNGARSEFAALLVAAAANEIASSKHKWLVFVTLSILVALLFTFLQDLIELLPGNRTLQLLDIEAASSWQQRSANTESALQTIREHPLLGDFGSYVSIGSAGDYAHNILSAWVDLGFIGFAWLLLMMVPPLLSLSAEAVLRWKSIGRSFLLPFSLVVVSALLLLVAKDFTYMLWAAGLGAYASYRRQGVTQSPSMRTSGYRPTTMLQGRMASQQHGSRLP